MADKPACGGQVLKLMLSNPFKSETIANLISKPDAEILGAGLEFGFPEIVNGRLR